MAERNSAIGVIVYPVASVVSYLSGHGHHSYPVPAPVSLLSHPPFICLLQQGLFNYLNTNLTRHIHLQRVLCGISYKSYL